MDSEAASLARGQTSDRVARPRIRVGHGLDSSTDWIGLDWVILCNAFCGLDWIGSDGEK